jgi:hypothetical protein
MPKVVKKRKPKLSPDAKPRSDAVLLNLPHEIAMELANKLICGMGYNDAAEWLMMDKGIKVSNRASFTGFWNARCVPLIKGRSEGASNAAKAHAEAIASTSTNWDECIVVKLKERTASLLLNPGADTEELSFLVGLVQRDREQDLRQQQLALDKDKFEFNAAKAALREVEKLKEIARNQSLDDRAKVDEARRALFGAAAVAEAGD